MITCAPITCAIIAHQNGAFLADGFTTSSFACYNISVTLGYLLRNVVTGSVEPAALVGVLKVVGDEIRGVAGGDRLVGQLAVERFGFVFPPGWQLKLAAQITQTVDSQRFVYEIRVRLHDPDLAVRVAQQVNVRACFPRVFRVPAGVRRRVWRERLAMLTHLLPL